MQVRPHLRLTDNRGTYEESTFWNPSWTVGLGHATNKCPATVCLANTKATHYGLGVLVLGDRIAQHPLFFGYSASMAQRIAAALTPDHPIPDFG